MITKESLNPNPIEQFEVWYGQALNKKNDKADAFALATSSIDGKPSVRILLFKGLNEQGFKFFTNFESLKAKDLDENPKASMLFFWSSLDRQVRIDGVVKRLSEDENDDYWKSRPRGSQIGAHASIQSSKVENRDVLLKSFSDIEKKFKGREIPRPDNWGGYVLTPNKIEFWQGLPNRLHDRIIYKRVGKRWNSFRLAP
jgi:pyridoxamine 5'-phosphate oxidase